MSEIKKIQEKIKHNVAKWNTEKTVAQYVRDHLSEQIDDGQTKADKILDSIYYVATTSEDDHCKIKASESLFKLASQDQKQETNTQVNIFSSIAEKSNESITKLVDVTDSNNIKKDLSDLI